MPPRNIRLEPRTVDRYRRVVKMIGEGVDRQGIAERLGLKMHGIASVIRRAKAAQANNLLKGENNGRSDK